MSLYYCPKCSITTVCGCDAPRSIPLSVPSNPGIPKVIVQTGKTAKDMPVKNRWRAGNPGYEYAFFDDNACIKFLGKHFGMRAALAFVTLRPGAFKADMFRYAYLYVHGGVYIDLDCVPMFGCPLDQILNTGTDMISVAEIRRIPGIWQAFLACKPGIEGLKTAVEMICSNAERRWYPEPVSPREDPWPSILSITGPVLLANALLGGGVYKAGCYALADGKTTIRLYNKSERSLAGPVTDEKGRALMLCTSAEYVKTRREPYENLVRERKVYNESIDKSTMQTLKEIALIARERPKESQTRCASRA